jgi:FAD/FMN-containing dehydrogenase
MNWRLPTGRMVRIGERVVKTTTGYDWHRFLLHSGLRFGEPVDYVLRLRPDCGSDTLVFLRGDFRDLSKAASILLKGGWMHWLESLDFMASESGVELRIWIHTVPEEAGIFEAHLTEIAALTQTLIEIQRGASPPVDGIPDLAIKTTPDRAIDLARSISNDAIHSAALCYSGVVHVWLPSVKAHQAGVESLVGPHLDTLLSIGGDWRSRHIRHDKPIAAEAAWIKTLEEAIHGT